MVKKFIFLLVFLVLAALVFSCQENPSRTELSERPVFYTWSHYLGDPERTHFSQLKHVNTSNVNRLKPVWVYNSGGLSNDRNSQIQTNPLIIGNKLFGVNASNELFAINAATGKQLWIFTPNSEDLTGLGLSRGFAYWASDNQEPARIFYSSGYRLFAISIESGQPINNFGKGGFIDLRDQLYRDPETIPLVMTTPGVIYKNLYITGSRTSESPGAAPGHIRAFNVITGELEWIFHTIPFPGEAGYETWPDQAFSDPAIGGANCWAGMALDQERGIVYVPTGSAAFDWYGGNRLGDNLYANSLIALNAKTGQRIWHFQMVKHDLWDRDLPATPNLMEVERDGQLIPAVAQVTKSGHVFVFNRITGEPLFPIEEQKYPVTTLQGDRTALTQPLPVKPLPMARQQLAEQDLYAPDELAFVDDFIDKAQNTNSLTVREKFREITSGGQFIPIDTSGVILYPGADGGAEWGGAAVDPRTGIMYVNSNEMAWIVRMAKLNPDDGQGAILTKIHCTRCHGGNLGGLGEAPGLFGQTDQINSEHLRDVIRNGIGAMPAMANLTTKDIEEIEKFLNGSEHASGHHSEQVSALPYGMVGFGRFKDIRGYPVVKPPWGTLNAIDLNTGEYRWKIPLGHEKGFEDPLYPVSGTENYGGPVITAGGLLFIAATKDEKFRAFNMENGNLLWEYQLPAGGYATPATYEVNEKQYIVIACGGGKMGTSTGDQYIAFSLE